MDNSLFCSLPPEIRNHIYSLAMGSDLTIRIRRRADSIKYKSHSSQERVKICMALAQTCKQVHQESTTLFYASNHFHFWNIDQLKSFINIIGRENAKSLRGPVILYFAETHYNPHMDEPAKPNKAGRDRLRIAFKLALSYGWQSLKVRPMFKTYYGLLGLYHHPDFDVMKPDEEWTDSRLDKSRHPSTMDFATKFDEQVEDEIKAWKEVLKKLHQG